MPRLRSWSPRSFFCQAEDGIRVPLVTGVQTCALPIFDGFLTDIWFTVVSPENQSAVASGRLALGLSPNAADFVLNWQLVLHQSEKLQPGFAPHVVPDLGGKRTRVSTRISNVTDHDCCHTVPLEHPPHALKRPMHEVLV